MEKCTICDEISLLKDIDFKSLEKQININVKNLFNIDIDGE